MPVARVSMTQKKETTCALADLDVGRRWKRGHCKLSAFFDAFVAFVRHVYKRFTIENAKDIIACGFDKKKTFIFSDLEYVARLH